MFFDCILENSAFGEVDVISEETQEIIDNIEINRITESELSPFELVSKALYEFTSTNYKTFNIINEAELSYYKEYGMEPVWEEADHKSLGDRLMDALKQIKKAIAEAIDYCVRKVDEFIGKRYAGLVEKKNELFKKLSVEDRQRLLKKKFHYTKYDYSYCLKILDKSPKSVLANCPATKNIYKIISGKNVDPKGQLNAANTTIQNGADGIIDTLNRTIMENVCEPKDYTLKGIRSKLTEVTATKVENASYNEIKKEIDVFLNDTRGVNIKKDLKDAYKKVDDKISLLMDDTNNYKKNTSDKLNSRMAGIFAQAINDYANVAVTAYKILIESTTHRFTQSIGLCNQIMSAAKGINKSENKDED